MHIKYVEALTDMFDVAQTDSLCLRVKQCFFVFTRCPNQQEISSLSLRPSTSSQLTVHSASRFMPCLLYSFVTFSIHGCVEIVHNHSGVETYVTLQPSHLYATLF